MIPLVGLSPRVPTRCGGQSCVGQRVHRNSGLKDRREARVKAKHRACDHYAHTLLHFLDTFANVAFNDVFNFIGDLVISSAVVIGPQVECRCPIRWTEGWLTCFQGHGCYDIQ